MKKYLLFLLSTFFCMFLFLFSCTTGEKQTGNYFKGQQLADNTFEKEFIVEVEQVKVPEMELANMWFIHYIDSLVLGRYGHGTGYFFKLFEGIENPSISTFLYEGKGPDEFLSASYGEYYHKNKNEDYIVYIEDPSLGKVVSFNLSEFKRSGKYEMERVSTFENRGYGMPKVLSEDKILYQDYRHLSKKHYLMLKEMHTDKLIKEIELSGYQFIYPYTNISFSQCASKDISKVALACSYMNQIVIVDLNSDKRVIFSTDKELLQWLDIVETTKEYIYEPIMFRGVKNIKNHIVANYIGNGEYSEFHVLDWNGKGVAKIKTPLLLRYFDYNKIDNHIYAFTEDEELYKIDLTGII